MAAGLIHFPLFVAHPWYALLHPGKALLVHLLLTLGAGEVLGSTIYLALRVADQSPNRATLHLALPLAAAALAGAVCAWFVGEPSLYPAGTALSLRSLSTRLCTAIPLALGATPTTRISARRGHSKLQVLRKDPRWRK